MQNGNVSLSIDSQSINVTHIFDYFKHVFNLEELQLRVKELTIGVRWYYHPNISDKHQRIHICESTQSDYNLHCLLSIQSTCMVLTLCKYLEIGITKDQLKCMRFYLYFEYLNKNPSESLFFRDMLICDSLRVVENRPMYAIDTCTRHKNVNWLCRVSRLIR